MNYVKKNKTKRTKLIEKRGTKSGGSRIQFLTIASSRPGYIILGQADAIPARDSWISHDADTRTPPHELGHCMGLHHRNTNKDALMCQTAYASGANADKLRKVEWDDLH